VVWDAKAINPPFTPTLGSQLENLTRAYKNKAITEEEYEQAMQKLRIDRRIKVRTSS
jgi:hypothetical protein